MSNIIKDKRFYRLKLATLYLLSKIKFVHPLLPKALKERLPLAWNHRMFWQAFKSRGTKIYSDYYVKLREPKSYEPKVEVEPPYQLSSDDIRAMYHNGYIGPFTLMSPEQAVSVREHLIDLALNKPSKIYSYADGDFVLEIEPEERGPNSSIASNYEVALQKMNWRDRHLEDPVLLNLFKHPAITERCAQILGPDLMLWRTQFFPKSRSNCGTPWHQATTYMFDNQKEHVVLPPDPEDLFQLTVWIALTDTTQETACMAVIPGSHKDVYPVTGGGKYDTSKPGREQNRVGTVEIKLDYPVKPENIQCIEMKAGQFFIFSERVIHGSLDNQADQWRWAVNGRIVRPDAKVYTDNMLKNGHAYKTQNVTNLRLDKWKGVMIRGQDRYGYNPMLTEEPVDSSSVLSRSL